MATATKSKPAATKDNSIVRGEPTPFTWDAGEILAAEMGRANALAASSHKLMEAIERRAGELVPHNLKLTPIEERLLKAGGVKFDSTHELIRILGGVRAVRVMLEDFSFEKLEAAKLSLVEATHAVETTQATMEDLGDIDGNAAEPVLIRQLAALQKKLGDLIATKDNAEFEVRRLESMLQQLERQAPQALKDISENRKSELRSTPEAAAVEAAKDELREKEQLVWCSQPGEQLDPRKPNNIDVWKNFCSLHLPAAAKKASSGFNTTKTVLDQGMIAAYLKGISDSLPQLREQLADLELALAEKEREINPLGPIHAWIDAKGMTTELLSSN